MNDVYIERISIIGIEPHCDQFILGNAIKIVAILSKTLTQNACTISIEDSSDTDMVEDAAMTRESGNVHSYIYQSDEDDDYGTYCLTVKATEGINTSLKQKYFTLLEKD